MGSSIGGRHISLVLYKAGLIGSLGLEERWVGVGREVGLTVARNICVGVAELANQLGKGERVHLVIGAELDLGGPGLYSVTCTRLNVTRESPSSPFTGDQGLEWAEDNTRVLVFSSQV